MVLNFAATRVTLMSLSVFSALLWHASSFASESKAKESDKQSIRGEGKTLPEQVIRVRALYRSAHGQSAFNSKGKKEDSGLKINAETSAYVFEYGLSQRLSVQVVMPVVHKNQMSMDGLLFQKTEFYQNKYNDFIQVISEKLVTDGLCASVSLCQLAIQEKGLSLPFNTTTTLPTGETLEVKAGVPIKTVASSLIVNAALPVDGRIGWGDLEVGALYAVADPDVGLIRTWPLSVSLGMGVRLPTGSFENVPAAQRGTGRGTADFGLRVNADKYLTDELVLSWQNQTELAVVSGKKRRSSLLNSQVLNSADPLVEGADKQSNQGRVSREGARQQGFFKLTVGGSLLDPSISFILLNTQWKYDLDSAVSFNGKTMSQKSALYSGQVGMTLDGLRLGVPMQLDLEYERPFAGEGRSIVTENLLTSLKLYYRI